MIEQTDARTVKIGEMLIHVGALTTGDLIEAIQIAKRMGVPIGRVLVMSGCVTEEKLQHTLELQSLLKDGLVDMETAYKALDLVFTKKMTAQEALKTLNWQPKQDQTGNKLGDLLVDSTIVTRAQLERALEASFQSGMPLGGTLVLQGILSAQLLPTVLHVQESIREKGLDREAAIEELKRAFMFWARADQSKEEVLHKAEGQKKSGRSTHQKMQTQQGQQPGGQAKPIFEATGDQKPRTGRAPIAEGAKQQALPNQVSLIELLKLSGFCTQQSLEKAIEQALSDARLATKLLLAIGFIDTDTLNTCVHVQALIARGKLRTDQALYVLSSVRHRKLTLEQALGELGIRGAI